MGADSRPPRRHNISTTICWPTSAIAGAGPQHVVSAISHLREAAADLDVALACSNIPSLYAAGPEQLRDLYRDLDARLAQLAEYVQAPEHEAGSEVYPRRVLLASHN